MNMVQGLDISKIPQWELDLDFDPTSILHKCRHNPTWTTMGGETPTLPVSVTAEAVLKDNIAFDVTVLPVRDPNVFRCWPIAYMLKRVEQNINFQFRSYLGHSWILDITRNKCSRFLYPFQGQLQR